MNAICCVHLHGWETDETCSKPAAYQSVNPPECPDEPALYCVEHAIWFRRNITKLGGIWCCCDEDDAHRLIGLQSLMAVAP